MSLSASWKRSLSFFCGLLVRRAADVRFFARFAMISPVGLLENACPRRSMLRDVEGSNLVRPADSGGNAVEARPVHSAPGGLSKGERRFTPPSPRWNQQLSSSFARHKPMRTYHRRLNAAA